MTKQQKKVHNYISNNPGCTSKDIMLNTGIQCPSGRITELRAEGIKIISIGKKRYPDSHPFEMYAIEQVTA